MTIPKKPFRRTRTEGNQIPLGLSYTIQRKNASGNIGAPTVGSVNTLGYRNGFRTMYDSVTPGFRPGRKQFGWINTPASSYKLTCTTSDIDHTSSSAPQNGEWLERRWIGDGLGQLIGPLVSSTNTLSFGSYPDVVDPLYPRKKAVMDCLNRVAPPSSQSLVSVAELPKSVDTILSRAQAIARAITAARKGDVNALRKMFGSPPKGFKRYPKRIVLWDDSGSPVVRKNGKPVSRYGHPRPLTPSRVGKLDEVSKLWLEYRYGWAPMVYDIVDSMKAIDAANRRRDLPNSTPGGKDVTVARATAKLAGRKVTSTSTSKDGGNISYTTLIDHEVEARAYAFYRMSLDGLTTRLNDFGAFDVPKAIWELVPFSFIVDWFVPIGDWLGAQTPKVGIEMLCQGVKVRHRKMVTRQLTSWSPTVAGPGGWPNPAIPLGTSDSFEAVAWERTTNLDTLFFPPLEIKLNLKRLADAAALFKRMR